MSFCLAKLKKEPSAPYRKISSCDPLYEAMDFGSLDLTPFDPDHRLDPESWFYLPKFRESDQSISLLKEKIDSKNYNELSWPELKEIGAVDYICSVQDVGVYFQKVTPSQFIKKKSLISMSDGVRVSPADNRILLNSRADAVYHLPSDRLIFKSLSFISSIFQNMTALLKEATREQVKEFLSEPFISLTGGFDAEQIGVNNRKRITLAKARLEGMPAEQRAVLVAYARQYCEDLTVSEDGASFEIKSDRELKSLLYALDERYYTTAMSGEKRLANSVKTVGANSGSGQNVASMAAE